MEKLKKLFIPQNIRMFRFLLFIFFGSLILTTGNAQNPAMYYGDESIPGRPFSKDPYVIFFQQKYWMYYSTPDALKKEWHIGIATSTDLVHWDKIGDIYGLKGTVEEKGICAPGALIKDGQLHLFYQTYGNGKSDAICHATSKDGINFIRNATNPIFHPRESDWSCGRAIDAEVVSYKNNYFLYFATRDTSYKIQQQGIALTSLNSNFNKESWSEVPNMPMLKPSLPWEKNCIEAASCIKKGKYLYMFYAGAYNNEPQQIGVAKSKDGIHWERISEEPFLKNGSAGSWNESESGHPHILKTEEGKYFLFFQGNKDKGKSWFISKVEIGWKNGRPYLKS